LHGSENHLVLGLICVSIAFSILSLPAVSEQTSVFVGTEGLANGDDDKGHLQRVEDHRSNI
jgi:hypothetical protein